MQRNQGINQATRNVVVEDNDMDTALEALGKSITRWTEKGELHTSAVPGLSLFPTLCAGMSKMTLRVQKYNGQKPLMNMVRCPATKKSRPVPKMKQAAFLSVV